MAGLGIECPECGMSSPGELYFHPDHDQDNLDDDSYHESFVCPVCLALIPDDEFQNLADQEGTDDQMPSWF